MDRSYLYVWLLVVVATAAVLYYGVRPAIRRLVRVSRQGKVIDALASTKLGHPVHVTMRGFTKFGKILDHIGPGPVGTWLSPQDARREEWEELTAVNLNARTASTGSQHYPIAVIYNRDTAETMGVLCGGVEVPQRRGAPGWWFIPLYLGRPHERLW